jgi:hypothetical protein
MQWSSARVVGLIVAGCVVGGLFLWNESWVKSPLIPLGLFGSKSNVACLGIVFSHELVSSIPISFH